MPRAKAGAKKAPIERLTHAARAVRREKIAAAVKWGMSKGEAARAFQVSLRTVRDAVAEFGA